MPGLQFRGGAGGDGRRLAAGTGVEAWFCADDVLSIGALAAVAEAGLRVPQDLGIIGLNDMEMAGWSSIALTTIHQPFAGIVAAAVDLIAGRMEAGAPAASAAVPLPGGGAGRRCADHPRAPLRAGRLPPPCVGEGRERKAGGARG